MQLKAFANFHVKLQFKERKKLNIADENWIGLISSDIRDASDDWNWNCVAKKVLNWRRKMLI